MNGELLWLPLGLLSALFAALVAIFAKLGLKGMDTTMATALRTAVMFVFMVSVVVATGRASSGIGNVSAREWLFLILSGVAGAMSWIFYFWALKVGRVAQVSAMDRLSLVFAVALAALFLGERLGWKTGLGTLIMCGGAILIALG